MNLFTVELIAEGIQVTAASEAEADRYARDDARDFLNEWKFQRCDISPASFDQQPAQSSADVEIDLTLAESPKKPGDELWTYQAKFTVTVEATDEASAQSAAKVILET